MPVLGRLGPFLGCVGVLLGALWGGLHGLWGNLWRILAASSAILGCRKPEYVGTQKSSNKIKETTLFSASRSRLWCAFGAFLERFGDILAHLGALLGLLGALVERLGAAWGPTQTVLGRLRVWKGCPGGLGGATMAEVYV